MDNKMWLVYSIAAGLCWGTYVPFVQQGIRGLQSPYGSFLCVGIAYFLIAVLFPIAVFMLGEKAPAWNASGITFATLAGVAGALGALCVIYANRSAAQLQRETQVDYRLFIGPIIFAMANPDPEITPEDVMEVRPDAIVATGPPFWTLSHALRHIVQSSNPAGCHRPTFGRRLRQNEPNGNMRGLNRILRQSDRSRARETTIGRAPPAGRLRLFSRSC